MPRSLQEVFVERDQHTCLWGTFSILSHGSMQMIPMVTTFPWTSL